MCLQEVSAFALGLTFKQKPNFSSLFSLYYAYVPERGKKKKKRNNNNNLELQLSCDIDKYWLAVSEL